MLVDQKPDTSNRRAVTRCWAPPHAPKNEEQKQGKTTRTSARGSLSMSAQAGETTETTAHLRWLGHGESRRCAPPRSW